MTDFLTITGVTKRFDAAMAVDGVDLMVEQGSFFALLGPSGCGKTTLLRMIGGFEQPDAGAIVIEGQAMNGVPPNRRPTNMVFQSYAIFPHLNVFDNIAFGLRQMGLSREALTARVETMLKTVRLEGMGARAAHALSGGQRQRVALARALVRQPKLLLLDEPLGALDKQLREAMQVELRALQKSLGITFLIVTHDQEEALSMADRVAVMEAGRILQVAAPRTLYERPATRAVAEFIGRINLFHASVKAVTDQTITVNAGVLGIVTVPRANAGFSLSPGDNILLALRPERIALAGGTACGTIIAESFLGERSHIHVALPHRREPVIVAGTGHAPEGPVSLSWKAEDIIVLPPDS